MKKMVLNYGDLNITTNKKVSLTKSFQFGKLKVISLTLKKVVTLLSN